MGRRRTSLVLVLMFLLLSAMFGIVLNVPLVRGSETIYIRADGSVEGTTDIVSSDNTLRGSFGARKRSDAPMSFYFSSLYVF